MSRFSIALGKILPLSPKLPKSLGPRTIVVGKPSSGKTTLLIDDAIKDLNTGVTKVLYCNYSTSKESVNIVFEKLNKKYIDNIFFIRWPDFYKGLFSLRSPRLLINLYSFNYTSLYLDDVQTYIDVTTIKDFLNSTIYAFIIDLPKVVVSCNIDSPMFDSIGKTPFESNNSIVNINGVEWKIVVLPDIHDPTSPFYRVPSPELEPGAKGMCV
jgi:hypothetical protein